MDSLDPFTDPETVARYAEDTARKVPGFTDLHRMAMILLAERVPETANILALGAGGGLELKAFAEAQPQWRFTGVDPSAEMLNLAGRVLGPLSNRTVLKEGYIDSAPAGPFDGATCLLTLHFLKADERLHTLQQLHQRMKNGAPLIVAHHSQPNGDELCRWFARSVAFAQEGSIDFDQASKSANIMEERLPILTGNEEEELLREAGFSNVSLFYAAFTFRGWVATA